MIIELDNGRTLELREPTIGDVMRANKHIASVSISAADTDSFCFELIASVAGVPLATIENLPVDDINAAMDFMDAFPIYPREFWHVVDEEGNLVNYPTYAGEVIGRSYILELDQPLTFGSDSVAELTIDMPNGKQLKLGDAELTGGKNPASVTKRMYKILQAVTGKEGKLLDKLPVTKFREASEVLRHFLGSSRKITGT